MNCVERMIDIAKEHGITTDSEFARVTGIPALKAVDFYSGKEQSVYTDTVELFCKTFNISLADFFQENKFIEDKKYKLANQMINVILGKKEHLSNLEHGEISFCVSNGNITCFKSLENKRFTSAELEKLSR